MKKRIVALILVLVMCFTLMSMVASAANLAEAFDTADGVVTTISAFRNAFKLPDQIEQLFQVFQFDKIQAVFSTIRSLLNVIS